METENTRNRNRMTAWERFWLFIFEEIRVFSRFLAINIAWLVTLVFFAFVFGLMVLLSGCAPYIEYEHLDATPFVDGSGDAYDLVCGGAEWGDRLVIDTAACKNLRDGGFLRVGVKWRLTDE